MKAHLSKIIVDDGNSSSDNFSEKRYVYLNDIPRQPQQQVIYDNTVDKRNIIPSKVLVIDNLSVTIAEGINGDFSFKVDTKPGVLSDKVTIPKLDINANEEIIFDEDITLSKLESIIRRCGVLEQYKEYLSNDPEIIINTYTLNIRKEYKFFNEFKEGVLIGEEIFM